MSSRYYNYYPPSRPRPTDGGIKAQSKRGGFGEKWWARRWVETLEGFNIGARLARGRTYARRGQVLSITVLKGRVTAEVQGSRAAPYKVSMKVKTLTGTNWKRVAEATSGKAVFAAKLLSGELPPEVESLFEELGLSLFPRKQRDLQTACSCPDWSNPCKHIAAVYYLLGEEFDRDPFLIFRLRGIERSAFISMVGPGGEKPGGKSRDVSGAAKDEPVGGDPLPADPGLFWNGGVLPPGISGKLEVPPVPAAIPKSLGSFPFWRGETRFLDFLEEVYLHGSDPGLELFVNSLG